MALTKSLLKIEQEIEAGLKFKSADRLRNLINEYPNNLELWERLAVLYYESGFLDAAGRYWILTEPKEDKIRNCVEIYEKSVNYSGTQILKEITFRGNKDKLNDFAREKLLELEESSRRKSNYVPTFLPKQKKFEDKNTHEKEDYWGKIILYLLIILLILTPILAIIGLLRVIDWIF